MTRAFLKNINRQILNNPRHFLAIFSIVALGVAFFSGVRAACPDMRLTLDKYFDDYNAYDIRVISTYGFEDEDIDAIKRVDGVQAVMPVYFFDGFIVEQDVSHLVSFQSLDLDALESKSLINRPVLIEGRFPVKENEVLMDEALRNNYGYKIGDTIEISAPEGENISDYVSRTTFTVTGFVRSVEYISYERGSSSKGDGIIRGFVYLPKSVYTMPVYTGVYIVVDKQNLSRFSDEYKDLIEDIKQRIQAVGDERNPIRYKRLVEEATSKLQDAKLEVEKAEQDLAKAKQELQEAEKKLREGEKELQNKEKEFWQKIKVSEQELRKAKKDLDAAYDELLQNQQRLQSKEQELAYAKEQLEQFQLQLQESNAALSALQAQIEELTKQLTSLPADSQEALQLQAQIASLQAAYEQNAAQYEQARQQYDAQYEMLKAAEQELNAGKAALDQGFSEYNSKLKEYEAKYREFVRFKKEGERQLLEAKANLEKMRQKYQESLAAYEDGYDEAMAKIQDARAKIEEGEKELSSLSQPEWYILDLSMNSGFSGYEQDTQRVGAIGNVFPLIFFLVAALVSLTNMTRMVEDDRSTIGVLKALGYSNMSIASKYMIYSGLAATGGIFFGWAVGKELFPKVIAEAYGIIYTVPDVLTALQWDSALLAGIGAFISAVVPAFMVCQKELLGPPAAIMRPRAPQIGKRILLERVPFIWKRLDFSRKVTYRNLFRYKKRLFMTVLGIAGCTALVFTGFGLKNSIGSMVPIQFEEIQKYDMTLMLDTKADAASIERLFDLLDENEDVKATMRCYSTTIDVTANAKTEKAMLLVPQDMDTFNNFVSLRHRQSGQPLELSDEGVVITEKLGKILGVTEGSIIRIQGSDNRVVEVVVSGIAENYIYHYVYLTPSLYQRLYRQAPSVNTVFGQLYDTSEEAQNALSESILQTGAVLSISFIREGREKFNDMIGALDIVVVVLIVSAAALAFVVLFSLTNINVDERRRELATLKVLGFNDFETTMYLYRENLILTVFGIGVGLILGVYLLFFVLDTVEVDVVMFSRRIHWMVYLVSALLTLVFALIVNLLTVRIIRKIDMVESLKSVE